jgi:hypothetical protein
VLVDRAPEGDDREVSIEVLQPKTPVGVGAKGSDDEPSDGDQPEASDE